jgi:hypothetical protein
MRNNLLLRLALTGALCCGAAFGAATITIVNVDGPNEGFNDPTPRAPVGGNSGTTLGQQRLIAFQYAASLWGAKLDSTVDIRIQASFDPLTCTATSAVLGSAGTLFAVRDFPGAEISGTWYHVALGNKLAGGDLVDPGDDLRARFNSNIGLPGCLTGTDWYYGLDTNHGTLINLVAVLLHEFGHGLGFSQFASLTSGALFLGMPDVYNMYMLDTSTGMRWPAKTNAERVASAVNSRKVVWTGITTTNAVPQVLSLGTPLLRIQSPAAIAGNYPVGTAAFGPALTSSGTTGTIVQALDAADGAGPSTTDGCSAITNAGAVTGNIALIDRGTCGFTVKVKNAQLAGAIAVIIADNAVGSPPPGLGGADPTITIPAVRITLADGNAIKAQLGANPVGRMRVDMTVRQGADASGRALLNAPNPVQPGSSISHWDPIAFRNQLMEPAINADLTHSLDKPEDMTLSQMRDIGWFSDGDGVPDGVDQCPNSDRGPNIVIQGCQTGVPNTTFSNGCRISDVLQACAKDAKNHGQYTACVAAATNLFRRDAIIDTNQQGAVLSCAAKATIP